MQLEAFVFEQVSANLTYIPKISLNGFVKDSSNLTSLTNAIFSLIKVKLSRTPAVNSKHCSHFEEIGSSGSLLKKG